MIADLYPEGAQLVLEILQAAPTGALSTEQIIDLEQFIADLQSALDDEAERQYISRTTY
jgi:hypothetical protein